MNRTEWIMAACGAPVIAVFSYQAGYLAALRFANESIRANACPVPDDVAPPDDAASTQPSLQLPPKCSPTLSGDELTACLNNRVALIDAMLASKMRYRDELRQVIAEIKQRNGLQ